MVFLHPALYLTPILVGGVNTVASGATPRCPTYCWRWGVGTETLQLRRHDYQVMGGQVPLGHCYLIWIKIQQRGLAPIRLVSEPEQCRFLILQAQLGVSLMERRKKSAFNGNGVYLTKPARASFLHRLDLSSANFHCSQVAHDLGHQCSAHFAQK